MDRIERERQRSGHRSVESPAECLNPSLPPRAGEMGLGLLVTQSILEDHGGKIWLMPKVECGTTFTFALPLMEKTSARGKLVRNPERKARDR
jgi:signal transduction histidine kinase